MMILLVKENLWVTISTAIRNLKQNSQQIIVKNPSIKKVNRVLAFFKT